MEKVLTGYNCIKCGNPVTGSYCKNCGIVDRKNYIEQKEDVSSSENMASITSLFQPTDTTITAAAKKHREKRGRAARGIVLSLLFVVLIGIIGSGFWFANQNPQSWNSPILMAAATPSVKGEFNQVEINKANVKTIDFDPMLKEGSLDAVKFAQFASADENTFIELFALSNYANKFIDKKITDETKKILDIKDDDIDVYFENKFAIVFSDDIKKWGLVAVTKNKKFADEKIALLDKYKALKVKPKGAVYDYTNISTKLIKYDGDKYYVLVSNSKEFLDRMVELSEGNLPNLQKSALYSASDDKAAGVAYARVFVSTKSRPSWVGFSEWYAMHFSYAGLAKIMVSQEFNNMIIRKSGAGVQLEILD